MEGFLPKKPINQARQVYTSLRMSFNVCWNLDGAMDVWSQRFRNKTMDANFLRMCLLKMKGNTTLFLAQNQVL